MKFDPDSGLFIPRSKREIDRGCFMSGTHQVLLMASSGGGGGGYLYWRINCTAVFNGVHVSIAEVQLRETSGGADAATGGTATASSTYDGSLVAANAFDDDNNTMWHSSGAPAQWIAYQFSSPKTINEVTLRARNDDGASATNQTPKNFAVQSSADGSDWTTEWSVTNAAWTIGLQQTFTRP